MRVRAFPVVALVALGTACGVGPRPIDATSVSNVPIHNTAAVVANTHAVMDVDDSPAALAVLAEPDRDPRDRALDARYQGADMLTFLGVHPGMRVLDLTTGGGYMTELLARGVGSGGQVFANNPPSLVVGTRIPGAVRERLTRAANVSVVPLARELSAPVPERARGLDLVYLSLPYRSAETLGIDTAAMNRAAFAALARGGTYVVVDFRPLMQGPTPLNLHALHGEESANVRRAAEAAGFTFVTEGRFLHDDPKPDEWNAILAPNPTALEEQDRFLLKFVKP